MNRLLRLDVRILYVVLVASIMVPLYQPLGLPLRVGDPAQKAYNFVDSLPRGSIVTICVDVAPSSEAENWPQTLAVARHSMSLGHKLLLITLLPEGVMYGNRLVKEVAEPEYDYVYGRDIVLMPYRAGQETAVQAFGENLRAMYDSDYYGTPVGQLPLMEQIQSIADVDLVATFSSGDTGWWFVRQVEAKFGTPVIAGTVGPGIVGHLVFLASGQLRGMLGGMAGAAEYEYLARVPDKALAAMDAQSIGHVYFVALMIISNLAYFAAKRAAGKGTSA